MKSRVIAAVAGRFVVIPSALGQLWIGWGIVKSMVIAAVAGRIFFYYNPLLDKCEFIWGL